MRNRKGFTLIELLIVVAIIALLVSILLPSLAKARQLTIQVMCLSNQHHLAIGFAAYSTEDSLGHYPACPNWQNAANMVEVYREYDPNAGDFQQGRRPNCFRGYRNNFFAHGLLYEMKHLDDPQCYYCPGVADAPLLMWPTGWNFPYTGWRFGGTMYRIFGQADTLDPDPIKRDKMIDELQLLEMTAEQAMTSDLFTNSWGRGVPAHGDPFGLNVAFGDGHAEFKELGEKEYRRTEAVSLMDQRSLDKFGYFYFRALCNGDFSQVDAAGFPAP